MSNTVVNMQDAIHHKIMINDINDNGYTFFWENGYPTLIHTLIVCLNKLYNNSNFWLALLTSIVSTTSLYVIFKFFEKRFNNIKSLEICIIIFLSTSIYHTMINIMLPFYFSFLLFFILLNNLDNKNNNYILANIMIIIITLLTHRYVFILQLFTIMFFSIHRRNLKKAIPLLVLAILIIPKFNYMIVINAFLQLNNILYHNNAINILGSYNTNSLHFMYILIIGSIILPITLYEYMHKKNKSTMDWYGIIIIMLMGIIIMIDRYSFVRFQMMIVIFASLFYTNNKFMKLNFTRVLFYLMCITIFIKATFIDTNIIKVII